MSMTMWNSPILTPARNVRDLESGQEFRHQLHKELGAGQLDGVDLGGVPPDEAKLDGYLAWRLNAAFTTPEQTQTGGQDAETRNEDSQMNGWKREFLLLLPDEDYRGNQANQKPHPAGGRCRIEGGWWRTLSAMHVANSRYTVEIPALAQ